MYPEEFVEFIDFFKCELQAAFFHMVEFIQGNIVAWLIIGLNLFDLATQAQEDQEIITGFQVLSHLPLEDIFFP